MPRIYFCPALCVVAAVLVTIGTFLYGTLIGWLVHWVLHQRWSGVLYRAHLTHHTLYPPANLTSDRYRTSGKDDGVFFFTPAIVLAFAAFVGVLHVLGISWPMLVWVCFEALVLGVAHDWLHAKFHMTETRFLGLRWFRGLRALHFYHHRDTRLNLGIFFFGWDRVLRTFRFPPTRR